MNNKYLPLLIFLQILFFIGCKNHEEISREKYKTLEETKVLEINLPDELNSNDNEFSGLAWYKNYLVMLPQYPQMFGDENSGCLFVIPIGEIEKWVAGEIDSVSVYKKVILKFNGLNKDLLQHGSGFEGIAFKGDEAFFTLEAREFFETFGNVIKGKVIGDLDTISLFPKTLKKIVSQTGIDNLSEEIIFTAGQSVITLHEANGRNVNARPTAEIFDHNLNFKFKIPVSNIEYRITDATAVDDSNKFWVINYLWAGDFNDLKPAEDEDFKKFGVGRTNQMSRSVERLIELLYSEQGIVRTGQKPIYLVLESKKSKNWEGVVRFKEGFLLVTDQHPRTILAFVKQVF